MPTTPHPDNSPENPENPKNEDIKNTAPHDPLAKGKPGRPRRKIAGKTNKIGYRTISPQIDWEAAEHEYICGYADYDGLTGEGMVCYPSYEEIARRRGLNIDTVKLRARANDKEPSWAQKREMYLVNLREKGIDATRRNVQNAVVDAWTMSLVKNLYKVCDIWIADALSDPVPDLDGNYRPKVIHAKDINSISGAIGNLQKIARQTIGEPVSGIPEMSTKITASTNGRTGRMKGAADKDLTALKKKAKELMGRIDDSQTLKQKALKIVQEVRSSNNANSPNPANLDDLANPANSSNSPVPTTIDVDTIDP